MNPDLLDPMNPQASVAPLTTMTRPLGTTLLDEYHCYICTVPAASTHRRDGKKLPFVNGFMRTNIKQDIEHMDLEIAEGNQYFRIATKEEEQAYDMRVDPKGTMKRMVREEITQEVRASVEAELRATLEAQIRAELAGEKGGIVIPDSAKVPLDQTGTHTPSKPEQLTSEQINTAQSALANVDTPDPRLLALRRTVTTGEGATLIHHEAGAHGFKPVSTSDIAAAAVASGK